MRRTDAIRTILEDAAIRRRDAQSFRSQQKNIRRRLPVKDFISARNGREIGRKAADRQIALDLRPPSAAPDRHRDAARVKRCKDLPAAGLQRHAAQKLLCYAPLALPLDLRAILHPILLLDDAVHHLARGAADLILESIRQYDAPFFCDGIPILLKDGLRIKKRAVHVENDCCGHVDSPLS